MLLGPRGPPRAISIPRSCAAASARVFTSVDPPMVEYPAWNFDAVEVFEVRPERIDPQNLALGAR